MIIKLFECESKEARCAHCLREAELLYYRSKEFDTAIKCAKSWVRKYWENCILNIRGTIT